MGNFKLTKEQLELATSAFTAFAGLVGLISAALTGNKVVIGITIALVLLAPGVYFYLRRRGQHKRQRISPSDNRLGRKAALRKFLPFQDGDEILGRESDLITLMTIVSDYEFRIGYVSGEAGSGKTSFIRASVVSNLRSQGWEVEYIDRVGNDLTEHLLERIQRVYNWAAIKDPEDVKLVRGSDKYESRRQILIIVDQFEEYFLLAPDQSKLIEFLKQIASFSPPVAKLLLLLRKEFVDDLRGLLVDAGIPNVDFHRLRNWDTETAFRVLNQAAISDEVGFSTILMRHIVSSLGKDGSVRPVELQLVATRLKESSIHEKEQLDKAGGIENLKSNFIQDAVSDVGAMLQRLKRSESVWTKDLALKVPVLFLKSLCEAELDVRRPIGLTLAELRTSVNAELQTTTAGVSLNDDDINKIYDFFKDQFLIIDEPPNRINLAHDYLVRPIRAATQYVMTLEERANRLLARYLSDEALAPTSMSLAHYRTIKKGASRERLENPEAVKLLSRAKVRFALIAMPMVALISLLLSIWLPTGTQIITEDILLGSSAQTRISADGSAFYVVNKKGVFAGNPVLKQDSSKLIGQKLKRFTISPDFQLLLGEGADGWKLFSINPDSGIVNPRSLALHISKESNISASPALYAPATFSPKSKWVAAVTRNENRDVLGLVNTSDPNLKMTHIDCLRQKPQDISMNNFLFSADDQWLSVVSPSSPESHTTGILTVIDLRDSTPKVLPGHYVVPIAFNLPVVAFSNDGKHIAFTSVQEKAILLKALDSTDVRRISNLIRGRVDDCILYFSENSKYLLVGTFGDYEVFDLSRAELKTSGRISDARKKVPRETALLSNSLPSDPIFSTDGKFVAFVASNGGRAGRIWLASLEAESILGAPLVENCELLGFLPNSHWLVGINENLTDDKTEVFYFDVHHPTKKQTIFSTSHDVRVYPCTDGRNLYMTSQYSVSLFPIGKSSRGIPLATLDDEIHDVITSRDRHKLFLQTSNRTVVVTRQFNFWGISITSLKWPRQDQVLSTFDQWIDGEPVSPENSFLATSEPWTNRSMAERMAAGLGAYPGFSQTTGSREERIKAHQQKIDKIILEYRLKTSTTSGSTHIPVK